MTNQSCLEIINCLVNLSLWLVLRRYIFSVLQEGVNFGEWGGFYERIITK